MLNQAKFLIFFFCSCIFANVGGVNENLGKVVIDTDGGPDDTAAILMLTAAESAHNAFHIVAVTCVYGNTYVENVLENVLKTLTIANRSDIKVYKGASKPIISGHESNNYFGSDGFGDVDFEENITAFYIPTKHSSVALSELARKYSDELTVISLGPLTNLAMAIQLDPDFVKNVRNFYAMGGVVHGLGSVGINKDLNFSLDPESNYILFESLRNFGKIIHFLPRETSYYAGIKKKWRLEVLGKINSTSIRFLNQVEGYYLTRHSFWSSSDVMAMTTMIRPELVLSYLDVYVLEVLSGEARGTLLLDYTNRTSNLANAKITDKVNVSSFLSMVVKYLSIEV